MPTRGTIQGARLYCRPSRHPPRRRNVGSWVALTLVAAFTLTAAPRAHAQDIRTVLTPTATAIRWDKDLGLRNKALYGGSLDLEFDRWVSLQGYFLTNNGVQTAAENLGINDQDAGRLGDQRLRLRSYGANVKLQLSTGDVVPYLDFGGGVLEFRPESADKSRQVALNVGGGLRFKLFDPLNLDLFARDAMFRINRFALFKPPTDGDLPSDPNADDLRHNLVVGVGLGIPFGPSRTEARSPIGETPWGVNGLHFSLEPMAGQLMFDTRDIEDQSLAGLRAGIDVGPLVGLRGFYWRGVSDNFSNTNPMQSWGGEAQFRLNSGTGIAPFVLLGGGQLDFKSSFRDANDRPVSDRTAFIAGGGVGIPLGERLALNLSARDYMFSDQSDLTDVTSADQLTHNWMWSAGLRFSLGGRRGSDIVQDRLARNARTRRQLEAARARQDSLEERLAEARTRRDSIAVRRMAESAGEVALDTTMMTRRGAYVSGRTVSIPVPTEGELYVRYGPGTDSNPPVQRARRGDAATENRAELDRRSAANVDRGARAEDEYDRQRADRFDAMGAERRPLTREELRELIRSEIRDDRVEARLDALHDEMNRSRMDALEKDLADTRYDAIRDRFEDMRGDVTRPSLPTQPSRNTTQAPTTQPRSTVIVPTPPRTSRPLNSSGGDVVTPPSVSPRVPVEKNRPVLPRDTSDLRMGIDSMPSPSTLRGDVRAVVDSIRMEQRMTNEESDRRTARGDSMLLMRVDSIVAARLAASDSARIAKDDADRQEQLLQQLREADARAREERGTQQRMGPRKMRTTLYGGANFTEGTQAIMGLRLDLGPIGRNWQSLHFLPELALGWGDGARSTMVAGNVQYGLPTLRISDWPAITPQIEAGVGILDFSDPVSSHDGTEGVINLGYGVGINLWRRTPGSAGPVLVVEHQGVDLFNLNRLLAGVRWAF